MKKLLYVLVFVFSLFFILFAINQAGISLYKEWGILIAWFVLIKLLEKKLFKDEEEDLEEDEEENKEWQSDQEE